MDVEWRPVRGFEGRYEVSNDGRLRALYSVNQHKAGRILKGGPAHGGYRLYRMFRGDGTPSSVLLIHKIVLEAFVGFAPEGMECRHLDGDPSNAHISNLQWGTRKENMQDKIRHGTIARGETHGMVKLSNSEVMEIRNMAADRTQTYDDIASRYGIARGLVGYIVKGKNWSHLPLVVVGEDRTCLFCGVPIEGPRKKKYCCKQHATNACQNRIRKERREFADVQ